MKDIRADFPLLGQPTRQGKPLVYLDSAATSQLPQQVIDAVANHLQRENANPHRGAYDLSVQATEAYESARQTVADFIGASSSKEIIFVKGSTEAANLLAYTLPEVVLTPGDEIVLSIAEHHSNLIPWQQVAHRYGAKLVYLYLDDSAQIPESEIQTKITKRTKIVSVGHCSNVLGTVHPVEAILAKAKSVGAVTILDGAQSVPHQPVNVTDLDVDFYFFSGHKMMAPQGIGVLYGKQHWLEQLPPFLFGGDMIEYVSEQTATFAPLPEKFEGGTQNVPGAVGLAAAMKYLSALGMEEVARYEKELASYALERLAEVPYLTIYGPASSAHRTGTISFTIEGAHPHDVATILDAQGIAIRSGHHCAQPLMAYLGVNSTCRMSLYCYNTKEEIDYFVEQLQQVRRWLGYESA